MITEQHAYVVSFMQYFQENMLLESIWKSMHVYVTYIVTLKRTRLIMTRWFLLGKFILVTQKQKQDQLAK